MPSARATERKLDNLYNKGVGDPVESARPAARARSGSMSSVDSHARDPRRKRPALESPERVPDSTEATYWWLSPDARGDLSEQLARLSRDFAGHGGLRTDAAVEKAARALSKADYRSVVDIVRWYDTAKDVCDRLRDEEKLCLLQILNYVGEKAMTPGNGKRLTGLKLTGYGGKTPPSRGWVRDEVVSPRNRVSTSSVALRARGSDSGDQRDTTDKNVDLVRNRGDRRGRSGDRRSVSKGRDKARSRSRAECRRKSVGRRASPDKSDQYRGSRDGEVSKRVEDGDVKAQRYRDAARRLDSLSDGRGRKGARSGDDESQDRRGAARGRDDRSGDRNRKSVRSRDRADKDDRKRGSRDRTRSSVRSREKTKCRSNVRSRERTKCRDRSREVDRLPCGTRRNGGADARDRSRSRARRSDDKRDTKSELSRSRNRDGDDRGDDRRRKQRSDSRINVKNLVDALQNSVSGRATKEGDNDADAYTKVRQYLSEKGMTGFDVKHMPRPRVVCKLVEAKSAEVSLNAEALAEFQPADLFQGLVKGNDQQKIVNQMSVTNRELRLPKIIETVVAWGMTHVLANNLTIDAVMTYIVNLSRMAATEGVLACYMFAQKWPDVLMSAMAMSQKNTKADVSAALNVFDAPLVKRCSQEAARIIKDAREQRAKEESAKKRRKTAENASTRTPYGVKQNPKDVKQQICMDHDARQGKKCQYQNKGCPKRHLDTVGDPEDARRWNTVAKKLGLEVPAEKQETGK